MGLTEGLGFEEVNQSVTSTAIISGTNVYGATSVQSATIKGTTISGTNVLVAGSVQADGKRLSSLGTGSPSTWGKLAQAGTDTTSAGSVVWVSYPTAFTTAPIVVASTKADTSAEVTCGSIGAGSFLATSHDAAAVAFNWIALG